MHNIAWQLALFGGSILWLNLNAWTPADVIWSFWSLSLIGGYLIILVALGSGLQIGRSSATPDGIGLISGLFLLGFFSFHFLFFHLIHAVFLEGFFPLQENRRPGPDMLLAGVENLWLCLQRYPGLLALLLAAKLPQLVDIARAPGSEALGLMMTRPYKSVVTIHLTIFLLGFATAFGASGPATALFLVFYFLPALGVIRSARDEWRASRRDQSSRTTRNPT